MVLRKLYLFFLFWFVVRRDDCVLIYHSSYTSFISRFCQIKRRHIILEVEEIYAYDVNEDRPFLEKEIRSIKRFNRFIVVNDYIPVELGIPEENRAISYGVIDPHYQKLERRFDTNHTHVLYAGIISERTAGAFASVLCAAFLPERFVLHIAGFGNDETVKKLCKMIEENNRYDNRCRIEFHGMLTGQNLDSLFDSCDIGISAYSLRTNFANHTSPSKLMTYATHGLKIVSGYSDALGMAKISRNWSFFHSNDPKEIASAVEHAEETEMPDYRALLGEIDDMLVAFLKKERFVN